jgi:hypothetical protein
VLTATEPPDPELLEEEGEFETGFWGKEEWDE